MIAIGKYAADDREEVIDLVLRCQNDGTRLIRLEDQPDLLRIEEAYFDGGGFFWVARERGKAVGTIGLMNKGNGLCVLKKFFVEASYRGTPHHLGQQLYNRFLDFAKAHGFSQIILDTPGNTDRAHLFYEKAGFHRIPKNELPADYDYPYDDSHFFRLEL